MQNSHEPFDFKMSEIQPPEVFTSVTISFAAFSELLTIKSQLTS